jgi:hypothetical protein
MARGRLSAAEGLDDQAHQVPGRIQQVGHSIPVGPGAGRAAEVGLHVFHGGLESVQPVVEQSEIRLGDDDLSGRHLQRVGAATGLVGPLAMRRAAEPPRAPRPRALAQWAMAPPASLFR